MCECGNDRWFCEVPIGIECQHWWHPNRIRLVSDICDLRIDELQMLDEGMSRSRRPIFTPQTFRSVVGMKGNEFVLKIAFVRVSNDLYVFVMVMKLRHEVSNALLNHFSLRVVIEEYCIWSWMALVVNHLVARSRLSNIIGAGAVQTSKRVYKVVIGL